MHDPRYAVYWQPGCSSCLKLKEFLARHRIAFESINVRATPGALEHLSSLGARSIPVIVRGNAWRYGQDLDDVALFVGVDAERPRLDRETLELRISRLLAAAGRFTARLPESSLESFLPGRADRTAVDLAWHIAMIVEGFLTAAGGGTLSFDFFERRPAGPERSRERVVHRQRAVAREFDDWRRVDPNSLPDLLDTYYGRRSLASVLERTAWHVAQHVRQLQSLLTDNSSGDALTDDDIGGLPLPDGVWDPEIGRNDGDGQSQ